MGRDLKGKELGNGIRQNKNGRYEARYVDRFGKRVSIYGSSKVDVKNKLSDALKENYENRSIRKRLKLSAWYRQWMDIYKTPIVRPSTKLHYESIYERYISPTLGDLYLDEIRQMHIQSLINRIESGGLQWETQNKVRILLLDMFNIAIENDYVVKNPVKGVRISRKYTKERVILSVEQQRDFFECSAGTFYDNLYVFAVNTGLRIGEIGALTLEDIDFKNHTISVTKTLLYQKLDGDEGKTFHVGPPKTISSSRLVPMNEECEKALQKQIRLKRLLSRKYKVEEEFKDLLFVTKFNTPINAQILCDSIKRIVDEINLQRDATDKFPVFSAHTFRHTFATRCIEAGILPKTVQKYLGHATLQMTMDLYVHVTEEFKLEEIKKLNNVFLKRPRIIPFDGVEMG